MIEPGSRSLRLAIVSVALASVAACALPGYELVAGESGGTGATGGSGATGGASGGMGGGVAGGGGMGGSGGAGGAPVDYPSRVLADEPLAYWRLNDASFEEAIDEVENAHPGDFHNDILHGVSGIIGGDTAMQFDGDVNGNDDFIEMHDHFQFGGTESYSIELWVKVLGTPPPGVDGTDYAGIAGNTGPGGGWALEVDSAGRIQHRRLAGATLADWLIVRSAPITDGGWHYVVGVFDGFELKLWIDGSDELALTTSAPIAPADNFLIGSGSNGALQTLTGVVDEVAVYDYPLSPSTITAHYAAGVAASAMPSRAP